MAAATFVLKEAGGATGKAVRPARSRADAHRHALLPEPAPERWAARILLVILRRLGVYNIAKKQIK